MPKGFVRIRHFGICSSSSKEESALVIKAQLPEPQPLTVTINKASLEPFNIKQCPCCKKETMQTIMQFKRRGPPADWKEIAMQLLECIESAKVS